MVQFFTKALLSIISIMIDKNKTILVAGGLGYIGSHVSVALVKSGYDVVIADNLDNSSIQRLEEIQRVLTIEKVEDYVLNFKKIDLTDKTSTLELFNQCQFDAVIVLAGLKSVGDSIKQSVKYHSINFGIITNILLGMEQSGCNSLVFSSSAAIYNPANTLPHRETSETGVGLTNPYATTKYLTERILEDVAKYKKNFRITSLRYFNPVGNHPSGLLADNPNQATNLFPIIARSILNGQPFQIFGSDYSTNDGTCLRDYISVEDVASAHVIVLESSILGTTDNYNVYNVGLGYSISVLELVETYELVNEIKLDYQFAPRRPGDVSVSYSDSSKIKMLGWCPKSTLEDCVRNSYTAILRSRN